MNERKAKSTSAIAAIITMTIGTTGLLILSIAITAGLRINGTHSFPVRLYLTTSKRPEKGDRLAKEGFVAIAPEL